MSNQTSEAELQAALAACQRERDWARLLFMAGKAGLLYWTNGKQLALTMSGQILPADADGLPIRTPELEAALLKAREVTNG